MKNTILSLMKIYSFNKVLVNSKDEVVDFVIVSREKSLTLNDWINLNIALKRVYNKKINYLNLVDAKLIYNNDLKDFLEVTL